MKTAVDSLVRMLFLMKILFITFPCEMSVRELCQFRFDVADRVEMIVLIVCLLIGVSDVSMYLASLSLARSMTDTQMYAIAAGVTGALMVSLATFTWYRANMCDPEHVTRRLAK